MPQPKEKYDVIIIGSGSSGCAAAVRAAQLGLNVICIDNLATSDTKKLQNGIFMPSPCLSSNALLESAKQFDSVVNEINVHGIYVDNVSLDVQKMIQRKDKILNVLNQHNKQLFSTYNVDFINAKVKLISPKAVEIIYPHSQNKNQISANHIILATESIPISITCVTVDNKFIFDSITALNITEVPKRLAILGAGVIGLEIAAIWNRLGAETILLDAQESFLSLTDNQISREAYKIFTDQGLELRLGTRVITTNIVNKKVVVEYQDSDGTHAIRVDKLIVASGRRPDTDNLAAPEANLLLDENGFVHVNDKYRTNLPNVYAIGDLTLLGPMLPHKGIAEGVFVAEQIAGISSSPIAYNNLPNVIYTEPEIAWVGQTEQAIKSKGDDIKINTVYLTENAKALSTGNTTGIIKIITCAKTDAIRGVHIIANNASELIAEPSLALSFSANNEDIAKTIHPFPSFVDSIRQASNSNLS